MMEVIKEFIRSKGYDFEPNLNLTDWGKISTEKHKGWYRVKRLSDTKLLLIFGDWRLNDKHVFVSDGSALDTESPEYQKLVAEEQEQRELWRQDARVMALATLNRSARAPQTGYLIRKGLESEESLYGEINSWGEWDLIVPMVDRFGEVWNIQRIQASGFKSFLEGGQTKGLLHMLPGLDDKTILVCEGIATALSIYQVLKREVTVVAAFSLSNLRPVCEILKEKHVGSRIVICSDNDHKKSENYGLKGACAAALELGVELIYPPIPSKETGSDWNDLCMLIGSEETGKEILKQLESPPSVAKLIKSNYGAKKQKKSKPKETALSTQVELQAEVIPTDAPQAQAEVHHESTLEVTHSTSLTPPSHQAPKTKRGHGLKVSDYETTKSHAAFLTGYVNGLSPLKQKYNSKGNPIPLEETEVAAYILSYYGESLLSFGGDLFLYEDGVWTALDTDKLSELSIQVMVAYNGKVSSRKIAGTVTLIKQLATKPPVDMYRPVTDMINFANGTLHIVKKAQGSWIMDFKPHSKTDYLITKIPINYEIDRTSKNVLFMEMLDNIFGKDGEPGTDPDKQNKIRLLQEMYGACLAPIFPHLFLVHGPGGSGKTSILIPAMRLVDKANWCSVEPNEMKGFDLESMVGKLVNFVSDIQVHEPINDAVIKRIEDRLPVTVRRKFKTALVAPIPAVHVFAGNDIPPTRDRGSNAFLRRWSFIRCDHMDKSSDPTFNHANHVFETSPEGILNWALEGLERLLKNERYHTFESERESVKNWQIEHDIVSLFLKEIGEGEVPELRFDAKSYAPRVEVWNAFVKWHMGEKLCPPKLGKIKFLGAISKKGHRISKQKGTMCFAGMSTGTTFRTSDLGSENEEEQVKTEETGA